MYVYVLGINLQIFIDGYLPLMTIEVIFNKPQYVITQTWSSVREIRLLRQR